MEMKLFLLLALLAAAGSVIYGNPPQKCSQYEPAQVSLKGTLRRQTFAGAPNFENINKGDAPETYWVLHLESPICVETNPAGDPDNEAGKNVKDIQLIVNEDRYSTDRDLVNKHVTVNGKLMHAISGHHHTPVLLEVTDIKRQ
jgi:hypothetical protein